MYSVVEISITNLNCMPNLKARYLSGGHGHARKGL